MALVVPCSQCQTPLAAPDSAVGQRLRCPKCGTMTTVPNFIPAEEVPVVEAKIAPPPVKPKPIVAEEAPERKPPRRDDDDYEEVRPRKKKRRYADEDDDYDHDRPRRRPARRRAAGGGGGSGALVAGLVIGGLLLLAGIGFAVYLFAGKNSPLAKKSPVPAGWEQHNYPQDGFKAYLPRGTTYVSVPTDEFRPGRVGRPGRIGAGGFDWADDLPPVDRFAMMTTSDFNAPVHIDLYVIKFRDRLPSSVRGQMRRGFDDIKLGNMEIRKTTWLGYDAVEQLHPGGLMRIVYTDRHAVLVSITGANGTRATPEEEAGFFDNFELTK